MHTKFYLDFRGKAKDNKGSLCILIFRSSKSASIPLGIRLSKNEWTGTKIINRVDSSQLNTLINKKKNDIDKRLIYLELEGDSESMSLVEIKDFVKEETYLKPNKKTIRDLFLDYMKNPMKYGTKIIYETTLSKIEKYSGKNITVDKLTYEWLLGFDRFLSQTQGLNGKAIYLRALRTICNYAVKIGVTQKYPFQTFHIKTEPTRKRSVSIEMLRKYYNAPVSESEGRYRDYFFIMFFLIGINAGDLLHLRQESVVDGRIEYIRAKTSKKYSIKLEPEVLELISRHKGQTFLLDALDTCKEHKNFIHMMNEALQDIGYDEKVSIASDSLFEEEISVQKRVPLIPDITTYFARHCWATYAYDIGIPIDVISQALGHSFGNRTTLIYIKYEQQKVDLANRKVIDYFFESLKA